MVGWLAGWLAGFHVDSDKGEDEQERKEEANNAGVTICVVQPGWRVRAAVTWTVPWPCRSVSGEPVSVHLATTSATPKTTAQTVSCLYHFLTVDKHSILKFLKLKYKAECNIWSSQMKDKPYVKMPSAVYRGTKKWQRLTKLRSKTDSLNNLTLKIICFWIVHFNSPILILSSLS